MRPSARVNVLPPNRRSTPNTDSSRSNSTISLSNQTSDYLSVLEEVSKYNIQLNFLEKLWAVRPPRSLFPT